MNARRLVRGLIFVGFVNGAYLACGGSDDEPSGAGGGSSATGGTAGADTGAGWAASACGLCVETACSLELTQCEAEPSCANYVGCIEGCPVAESGDADPTCEAACSMPSEGAGLATAESFASCRASSNCTPCGTSSDAGTKHPILNQACTGAGGQSCSSCEDAHCCKSYEACAGDADCQAIKNCLKACTDSASKCYVDCFAANPNGNGKQLTLDRFACLDVLCGVECGEITEPCDICFRANCGNTLAACDVDEKCWIGSLCISECAGDQTCVSACVAQVTGPSLDILNAFLSCSDNACAAECAN